MCRPGGIHLHLLCTLLHLRQLRFQQSQATRDMSVLSQAQATELERVASPTSRGHTDSAVYGESRSIGEHKVAKPWVNFAERSCEHFPRSRGRGDSRRHRDAWL